MPTIDGDELDPRLLKRIDLPKGQWVDIRLDWPAHGVGVEAQELCAAYPEDNGHADFVRLELELVDESIHKGAGAAFTGDRLTAWMHARLLAECAIRLGWVCTDASNAEEVVVRIHRLERRDLNLLLESEEALRRSGSVLVTNPDVVKRRANRFSYPPAPTGLQQMAREAGVLGLYGVHRWSSIIVHPGFGSRQYYRKLAPGEPLRALLVTGSASVIHAALVLKLLHPDAEPPALLLSQHLLANKGELKMKRSRRTRSRAKPKASARSRSRTNPA